MKTLTTQIASIIMLSILSAYFIACKKEMNTASANQNSLSAKSQDEAKAVTTTTNVKIPIELTAFIPCANDGLGENVDVSGPLHILIRMTINGNNFSAKTHYQPQGLSGYGEITGKKYQATGGTQEQIHGSFVNGQYTDTYVNNFRIIGQGSGNNYLVHENVHITFNANGVVTAYTDNLSVECK
jgi:hypothetical protein